MVRSTVEAIKTTKRNASAHNIVHRVGLYANKNATETPGDRCRCVWWVCALRDDGTHINMCGILTLFVNMHYYWETPVSSRSCQSVSHRYPRDRGQMLIPRGSKQGGCGHTHRIVCQKKAHTIQWHNLMVFSFARCQFAAGMSRACRSGRSDC